MTHGERHGQEGRRRPSATVTESSGITWNGANGTLDGHARPARPARRPTVEFAFTWSARSCGQGEAEDRQVPDAEDPGHRARQDRRGRPRTRARRSPTRSRPRTPATSRWTNVVLTDDKCQSTLTRAEPNLADPTFDPGDEWFYTCTVIAPAGPARSTTSRRSAATTRPPQGRQGRRSATRTRTRSRCRRRHASGDAAGTPPVTPPGDTPPSSTPTPPGSGESCPRRSLSGRAVLRGPSGCVKTAFRARVRGRSISSVTFFVDGRRVKQVNGKRACTG